MERETITLIRDGKFAYQHQSQWMARRILELEARLAVLGKVEEYVTNLLRSERERTYHGSSANERHFMAALELVRN